MATPTRIHIGPDNTGLWRLRQSAESATAVTGLLQDDLKTHHVFFNNDGFHNHIPHQLLSLYGTGASTGSLQNAYNANKGYQRPAKPPHRPKGREAGAGAAAPSDPPGDEAALPPDWYETTAPPHLGHEAYYPDFLQFFQQDIHRRGHSVIASEVGEAGWQAVVRDRLFAGTPAADDLLARLFAGFLHPLIQLMYGLEWNQPAIVAQGLAQAAVHKLQGLDDFLFDVEKEAKRAEKAESLLSLYEEVARSPELSTAVHFSDSNKMRDGVLARARDAMVAVAARVSVPVTEADVAAQTAEMSQACVYVAASAALHPHKHPKFDFFLIHHINSIPFFLTLNSFSWLPLAAKARILEWKIRLDLVQYASRACPPLLDPEVLEQYKSPTSTGTADASIDEATASAKDISAAAAAAAARLFHFEEDGHAIKLVRATGLVEREVRQSAHANAPWQILKSDSVWKAIYQLETDSVSGPGDTWVRTAGLEEAWEYVQDDSQYEP